MADIWRGWKMVSAVTRDYSIGDGVDLLHYLKDDMAYFVSETTDHAFVVGRKTFEALSKGMIDRAVRIAVLTKRDQTRTFMDRLVCFFRRYIPPIGRFLYRATKRDKIVFCESLEEAYYELIGLPVAVIGGENVYREALPHVERVVLTCIESDKSGPVRFPYLEFTNQEFESTSVLGSGVSEDRKDGKLYSYTVCAWVR